MQRLSLRVNKPRCLRDLSIEEQMEIVHKAVVSQRSNIDIATEHRIRPVLVSNLVCKLMKNPKAFDEMELKLAEKASKDQLIHDATELHLNTHRNIWNAA